MKAINTSFDGYRFRSRVEARWAVFFKAAGLRYEYEPEGVVLPSGPYLPDFRLPDLGAWLEVKGADPTEEEFRKAVELGRATGDHVLISSGAPGSDGGLLWPTRRLRKGNELDDRFMLLADRRDEGVYWLGALDGSQHTLLGGPGVVTEHDRMPGMYGAIKDAYDAARAARFEHGESPA